MNFHYNLKWFRPVARFYTMFKLGQNLLQFWINLGSNNQQQIIKNAFKKQFAFYHYFFYQFWMGFGSILGAQGGSKEPLLSIKNRFCGSSGGQDGARGLQGTPKLPKWSSKAPKMEPQRPPGLSKGSPGGSQTPQKMELV